MTIPGLGCCGCCAGIQVNAKKIHAGFYPLFDDPLRGNYRGDYGADNSAIQDFYDRFFRAASLDSWAYAGHVQNPCTGRRFLRMNITGYSAKPKSDGSRDVIEYRGEMQIDRRTGQLSSAAFFTTLNGGTEELYWQTTLDEVTGTYSTTDNSGTATPPLFRSMDHALAQVGGWATISAAPDYLIANFYIPDIDYAYGVGGGPHGSVTQQFQILLSDEYDQGALFEDLQELLDSVDLSDFAHGDPTGTFVPLAWQTEYQIGWTVPDIHQAMTQHTYVWNAGGSVCTDDPTHRPFFPPYAAKIYGDEDMFDTYLNGIERHSIWPHSTTPLDSEPNPTGISAMQYLPFRSNRSGEWGQLSKARVVPGGEDVHLYSVEQLPCDCVAPEPFVLSFDCDPNGGLEGTHDCDLNFYDADSPRVTCTDGNQSHVCLFPGDLIFAFGISALYPLCFQTNTAGQALWCPGLNTNPCT